MKPIETVFAKLREIGSDPVESASGWQCRCPAHEDAQPSLSISETEDGKVLINCHAGCQTTDIVAKLGLTMSDLFPPKAGKRKGTGKGYVYPTLDEAIEAIRQSAGRSLRQELCVVARYAYQNEAGADAFVVVRFEPEQRDGSKTYRPFHAADGGWRSGDPEGLLPLYRLAEVKAATGRIYVVEGEKCAEAARALGLTCTTSAHGAKSPDKTDWSPLAGHDVAILPDNDEPGSAYAMDVARTLAHLAPPAKIKIVTLPGLANPGDDIADFIESQKDQTPDSIRGTIESLADSAPEWVDDTPRAEILDAAPDTINRPLCLVAGRGHLTTWVHVRMAGEEPVKRVVLREDGVMFAEAGVPGAQPLDELTATVKLDHMPLFDSIMSGAALKRYAGGERVKPAEVFTRVSGVIDHFMDFSHSLGTQADLVDLMALYVLTSYLLDAFSVIGYVWPNGDKGVGKTKLLAIVTQLGCLGVLEPSQPPARRTRRVRLPRTWRLLLTTSLWQRSCGSRN